MNKPEVEAVRFRGADVIATSGGPGPGVYYALGSEVLQATLFGEPGTWYYTDTFHAGATENTFEPVSGGWSNVDRGGTYMWYENGNWEKGNAISTYYDGSYKVYHLPVDTSGTYYDQRDN